MKRGVRVWALINKRGHNYCADCRPESVEQDTIKYLKGRELRNRGMRGISGTIDLFTSFGGYGGDGGGGVGGTGCGRGPSSAFQMVSIFVFSIFHFYIHNWKFFNKNKYIFFLSIIRIWKIGTVFFKQWYCYYDVDNYCLLWQSVGFCFTHFLAYSLINLLSFFFCILWI